MAGRGRNVHPFQPFLPSFGYCEQEFPTTFPDSTRRAGPCAAPGAAAPFGDADALSSTSVPVSSSFLPTCGVNAAGFAMRRYVWPEPAVVVDGDGDVGAGVSGDVEAPLVSAGFSEASARMYFASDSADPDVPVAPGVPVAAVVPVVPVASAVVASAAERRQPVTVTLWSDPAVVVCGVDC